MREINVLSLGAGVQSTTMLLMVCKGVLPKPDLVIFADVGWEPKGVYKHLEWLTTYCKGYGIEIQVHANGNIREDVINAVEDSTRFASLPFFTLSDVAIYEDEFQENETEDENQVSMFDDFEFDQAERKIIGYKKQKGMVRRQCTNEYKIQVVRKAVRTYLGLQKGERVKDKVIMWKGISTDEIQRMDVSRDKWQEFKYPLIDHDMSRLDCMNWLVANGYVVPPKSSCIGCPFHNDGMWKDMKENDPESWEDAVFIDKIIKKLPRFKGQAFLHRSCKPLDEVDFNDNQMDIDNFINECTGNCGV